jgi:hypothetical protein
LFIHRSLIYDVAFITLLFINAPDPCL